MTWAKSPFQVIQEKPMDNYDYDTFLSQVEEVVDGSDRLMDRNTENIESVTEDLCDLRTAVRLAHQQVVEAVTRAKGLAGSYPDEPDDHDPETSAQGHAVLAALRGIGNIQEFATIWHGILIAHLSVYTPQDSYRQFMLAKKLTASYGHGYSENCTGMGRVPVDISEALDALGNYLDSVEHLGQNGHSPVDMYRSCGRTIVERVYAALGVCQEGGTPGEGRLLHPELQYREVGTNTKIMQILGGAVAWYGVVAVYICDTSSPDNWGVDEIETIVASMNGITFSGESE